MTKRQHSAFAVGVLLVSLTANAFTQLAGCINKPAKVVYFEINAGERAGKPENRNSPTSRPVARSAEGTPHPTGSTDADAGRADQSGLGWSEADKAAVEFGLRELSR